MKAVKNITPEQALRCALTAAKIDNEEYRCLSTRCADGFYQLYVCTPYLKYEFYVDALNGDVLGIDTVPPLYPETLSFWGSDDENLSAVA